MDKFPLHIRANIVLFFGRYDKRTLAILARIDRLCMDIARDASFNIILKTKRFSTDIFERIHSIDDQPAIIYANGDQWWYQHGECHRNTKSPLNGETLPAIICANGDQEWWQNGGRHRDDVSPYSGELLPAVIYACGYKEKWQGGCYLSQ